LKRSVKRVIIAVTINQIHKYTQIARKNPIKIRLRMRIQLSKILLILKALNLSLKTTSYSHK
jgi:hypothetical protein